MKFVSSEKNLSTQSNFLETSIKALSKSKKVKDSIVSLLENQERYYELMLILTVLASYYVNSESVSQNQLPRLTVDFLDCFTYQLT